MVGNDDDNNKKGLPIPIENYFANDSISSQ